MTVGSHVWRTCAAFLLDSPDQLRNTLLIPSHLTVRGSNGSDMYTLVGEFVPRVGNLPWLHKSRISCILLELARSMGYDLHKLRPKLTPTNGSWAMPALAPTGILAVAAGATRGARHEPGSFGCIKLSKVNKFFAKRGHRYVIVQFLAHSWQMANKPFHFYVPIVSQISK
jgi:hypothetical protein